MPGVMKMNVTDAQEWVRRALQGFDREEITRLDEILSSEEWTQYVDGFRPTPEKKVKATAPKKTKATETLLEAANKPWDACMCDARCSRKSGGVRYPSQCTNTVTRVDGETCCLCTNHATKARSKKGLEYGFYNQERPKEYADGSSIVWFDSDPELIEKKKSPKKKVSGERKPRACSLCGQVGHTKGKCPMKSEANVDEPKEDIKVELSAAQEKMPPHCLDTKWDESKGIVFCGGCNSEFTANFLSEKNGVLKCHSCWTIDNIKENEESDDFEPESEPEPEPAAEETLAHTDSSATDPLSDDEEQKELEYDCESDDGDENMTKFEFEGVPYEHDSNKDVYDAEFECVGKWNGETIEWKDGLSKKQHESDRAELTKKEDDLTSLSYKELVAKARELGVDADKLEDARDLEGSERIDAIVLLIKNQ
jgi:hypothetical protein